MAGTGPRAARTRPFLAQRLAHGADAQLRPFPATFSVHDEDGVLGLYLSPVDLGWLAAALAMPEEDRALVVDGRARDRTGTTMPWSSVGLLHGEVELVHLPADRAAEAPGLELPVPLLTDPARALDQRAGSRVALSLHDHCHAVVLSREQELLAQCVGAFITGFVEAARPDGERSPLVDPALLVPLVEPLPDDVWLQLSLDTSRRFWTLTLTEHADAEVQRVTRWVCEGAGGRWRAGWHW
jgi:hypothetical protein